MGIVSEEIIYVSKGRLGQPQEGSWANGSAPTQPWHHRLLQKELPKV